MTKKVDIVQLLDDLSNVEAYLSRVKRILKAAQLGKTEFNDGASPPWQELAIPVRAQNCIQNELGPNATISDVAALTEGQWLRVPNSGRKTVNAIIVALAEYGEKLKGYRA